MPRAKPGEPECGAHLPNKPPDAKCRNPAGYKTDHFGAGSCYRHGGSTPNGSKYGRAIILDREIRKLLAVEGYEPITDPYTALSNLAGEVVKLKDVLLGKVEELTDLRTTLLSEKAVAEQIDVVFAAYERALDRCERVLSNMARLDLEDRIAKLHARINNDAAVKIISALNGALDSANVEEPLRGVIQREFGLRLRGDSGPIGKRTLPVGGATALVGDGKTGPATA